MQEPWSTLQNDLYDNFQYFYVKTVDRMLTSELDRDHLKNIPGSPEQPSDCIFVRPLEPIANLEDALKRYKGSCTNLHSVELLKIGKFASILRNTVSSEILQLKYCTVITQYVIEVNRAHHYSKRCLKHC